MGFFRHQRFATTRGLFVAASLVGFLAATVGAPVVVRVSNDKDRSQPYPCMNHPCGCRTAEACWRGCCCFTMAQKLAWAKENGVTPPAYVVAAARREARAGSCCQTDSHCDEHEHPGDKHEHPANIDSGGGGVEIVFVLAEASRSCQGHSHLWLLLGAATLVARVEFVADLHCLGEIRSLSSRVASLSLRPAVPPPRMI